MHSQNHNPLVLSEVGSRVRALCSKLGKLVFWNAPSCPLILIKLQCIFNRFFGLPSFRYDNIPMSAPSEKEGLLDVLTISQKKGKKMFVVLFLFFFFLYSSVIYRWSFVFRFLVICHLYMVIFHQSLSLVMCHLPLIICHQSFVLSNLSLEIGHLSFVISFQAV